MSDIDYSQFGSNRPKTASRNNSGVWDWGQFRADNAMKSAGSSLMHMGEHFGMQAEKNREKKLLSDLFEVLSRGLPFFEWSCKELPPFSKVAFGYESFDPAGKYLKSEFEQFQKSSREMLQKFILNTLAPQKNDRVVLLARKATYTDKMGTYYKEPAIIDPDSVHYAIRIYLPHLETSVFMESGEIIAIQDGEKEIHLLRNSINPILNQQELDSLQFGDPKVSPGLLHFRKITGGEFLPMKFLYGIGGEFAEGESFDPLLTAMRHAEYNNS